MTRFHTRLAAVLLASAALLLPVSSFAAPVNVNDQNGVNFAAGGAGELLLQSYAVPGGTLYSHILRDRGVNGPVLGIADTFVPSSAGGLLRYLKLTDAKSDAGVPMTASAGTPTGTVGVSRTAGTSLQLAGEATSSSAKTDKALFEFDLADSYVAGTNVPVTVNANYTGSGTLTAANTTLTVAAYTEVNGVETALTVSAAQQFTGVAANYVFTITGTSLLPGSHITVEIVMLVTSASGANTGFLNSVAYQG